MCWTVATLHRQYRHLPYPHCQPSWCWHRLNSQILHRPCLLPCGGIRFLVSVDSILKVFALLLGPFAGVDYCLVGPVRLASVAGLLGGIDCFVRCVRLVSILFLDVIDSVAGLLRDIALVSSVNLLGVFVVFLSDSSWLSPSSLAFVVF